MEYSPTPLYQKLEMAVVQGVLTGKSRYKMAMAAALVKDML
jgi:hypothetical protein